MARRRHGQRAADHPSDVHLPPSLAERRLAGGRMVVVVPALAPIEQGDQPIVPAVVAGSMGWDPHLWQA